MQPRQIQLVRYSFVKIAVDPDAIAELFYGRLFELDPGLKPMFKSDMKTQGRKLMSTLKMAIHYLDRFEELLPTLQALGRRHTAYGVSPAHYSTVGEALIWALAQGLGSSFTPEVKAAWLETYTLLSNAMIETQTKTEERQSLSTVAIKEMI